MPKSQYVFIYSRFIVSALAVAVMLSGCTEDTSDESNSEAARHGQGDASPDSSSGVGGEMLGQLPPTGDPLLNDLAYLNSLSRSGDAETAKGDYWMRRTTPESALVHYQAALKYSPEDANRLNSVGIVLRQLGRNREAKEAFIKAVDADQDNVHSYVNLGNVYFEQHELEKAEAQYMLATIIDSTDISGLYNYALTQAARGDTKAGIITLYRAINQYPEDPQLREKLGDYFMDVKAYKRAVEQWTEALALDPLRNHLREQIDTVMSYMRENGIIKEN